jgi:phage gpG-like protein
MPELKAAIKQAQKELVVIAGRESVNFFKDRFRMQGWIDNGFAAWQKRKKDKRIGGALLVATGKLRNSIRVIRTGADFVVIGSHMPYSQIHNEGFNGTEQVRAHQRKTFKQMMVASTSAKTGKISKRSRKVHTGNSSIGAFTRHMHMPKRQFMGQSNFLDRRIEMIFKYELDKIK